jgi:hypothetical protein
MAKQSKKKTVPRKKEKRPKAKGNLTILALVLIALTGLWTLGTGNYAIKDVFERRNACQNWLVEAGRGQHGYLRVYDLAATQFGCSVTKLGLKGYMAEKPI